MAKRYQASLTTGDLLQEEITTILNSVSNFSDINMKSLNKNQIGLKVKSEESLKRIFSESVRRINSVPDVRIWTYFLKTNDRNQKLILFYAILMTYDLLLDFVLDVVHERWINFQTEINRNDFMEYVEQKTRTTPELESKSKRSVSDMAFNILKVMRQAGVLDKTTLQNVVIEEEFKENFEMIGEGWFIDILPKN